MDIFDLNYPSSAEREQQLFINEQQKYQSGRLAYLEADKQGWCIANQIECRELSFVYRSKGTPL